MVRVIFMAVLIMTTNLSAQTKPTTQPSVIRLWTGDIPGARGNDPAKDVPTLTVFPAPADKATGAAMIICPGGGYQGLAAHEGRDYALFLNAFGVTCFVLKYRLGSAGYRHSVMLTDAQRAIRLVRADAAKRGLDPKRIGIMGSSAGGHLASTAVTHFDDGREDAEDPVERVSSRPDVGVLCYPVITLGEFTHQGSKTSLLGENPRPDLVELLSTEKQVLAKTPPCFLWHTTEDKVVPAQNSLMFADALQRHGVPYALHIYQKGSHGLGLGPRDDQAAEGGSDRLLPWTRQLVVWLQEQRFAR